MRSLLFTVGMASWNRTGPPNKDSAITSIIRSSLTGGLRFCEELVQFIKRLDMERARLGADDAGQTVEHSDHEPVQDLGQPPDVVSVTHRGPPSRPPSVSVAFS